MSQNDQVLISVGVDPGPVSGHVCFIGPAETVIVPTPADAAGMYHLFDWTGQAQYIVALERQQTFGTEARGRLVPLIREHGQWQGVLAVLQSMGLGMVTDVQPKTWQWTYEPLLPQAPKEPKQRDYHNVRAYKRARTEYRRARERVKGRRKTVLFHTAQQKAPRGLEITRPAADAYLIALHAENVLRREYGLERFHVEQ